MRVGDYVRTDDGFISKYIGKNKNKWCMSGHLSFESTIRDIRYEELEEDNIIWESEIEQGYVKVKSSPNIIDLIEVGDYVNGEYVTYINKNDNYVDVGYDDAILRLKDIKSILTKEQFESMEYKI